MRPPLVRHWRPLLRASALLLLLSAPTQAAQLRKGPYLIYQGDPTAMTVRWQTDATPSVGSVIDWGLTQACELGSQPVIENSAATDEHLFAATLTGLTPGERYFYRVTVDSQLAQSSFLAAPAPGATAVVFYAYGDTRSNPAYHDRVSSHILADVDLAPDLQQTIVLHSGDWVAEGNLEPSWDLEYFSRTQANALDLVSRLPVIGARGNHEADGALLKKYWPFDYVERTGAAAYHSFDYGPLHVTVVDQYVAYGNGSAQYDWVEQDLANARTPWKVVVLHAPPYAAGGSHGDNTTTQQELVPLFEAHGVDVVIAGHNHHYARAVRNGIQYVITGGGGAGLYSVDPTRPYVQYAESVRHFVRFAINGPALDYMAVRDDGTVIELLQLRKGVDRSAPLVLAVLASGNPNQARVIFNEALEAGGGLHGAENPVNYGIPGFMVQSALLDSSGSRVTIGVTPQFVDGRRYTLSVRDINDRAPLPNTMAVPQLVDFVFAGAPPPPVVLVEIGDPWRYFKGSSHPGTTWAEPGFDASSWQVGPTGIGYGDADDATELTDMQNGYLTVYLRRTFNVPDPASVVELTLYIDYDDGFVAAINGQEVVRRGVPAGQDHNTAATSHEAGNPETVDITNRGVLVAGPNVISIEVHNSSLGSSDLSVLPRLSMRTLPPPRDAGPASDATAPADAAAPTDVRTDDRLTQDVAGADGNGADRATADAAALDHTVAGDGPPATDSGGSMDRLARDAGSAGDRAGQDAAAALVDGAPGDVAARPDGPTRVRVAEGCACSFAGDVTSADREAGDDAVAGSGLLLAVLLLAGSRRRRATTCR